MAEKVIVEVFGIKNQASGGSSSCGCHGGCCSPSKTMGKIFEEFSDSISKSRIRNHIDIRFIDVLKEDMDRYTYAMEAMEKGYGLPLTAINGRIKFYGGLSYRKIYGALIRSV